ncbi:MAG: alpha-ribazole phosphatase [Sporomusaceae bacterium]|nr:alpha-ribazole phosphatase [Sporomusaceae bacterium]
MAENTTRVILVRHGQTEWNVQLKYQGHSEVPLTAIGIEQAKLAAVRLSREPVAAIYSSDLGRAAATAQYIAAEHQLQVQQLRALREFYFGNWEGLRFQEVSERWPQQSLEFFQHPESARVSGGETFAEVQARAVAAVKQLVAQHENKTILVVSHGGTIRTLLCAALGLPLERVWAIRQDNTAVNVIEYYPDTTMVALVNDIHHLQG